MRSVLPIYRPEWPPRHRLNRGDDRQANSALHTVAMVRPRGDTRTRVAARRTIESLRYSSEASGPTMPR